MTRRKQLKPRACKRDKSSSTALQPKLYTDERSQLFGDSIVWRHGSYQVTHSGDTTDDLSLQSSSTDSEDDTSTDSRSTVSDLSLGSTSPEQLDSLVTNGVTDSTPYKCSYCPRAYPRLTLMKLHEQTHTEQLPYECEFCRHRFKHKRSKDRHVKLHTGEKKFKCKLCPSAYCRSDHLKIHLRSHDKKKPHQCGVCSRGYRTAAALTSHQQRHAHGQVKCSVASSMCQRDQLVSERSHSREETASKSDKNGDAEEPTQQEQKEPVKSVVGFDKEEQALNLSAAKSDEEKKRQSSRQSSTHSASNQTRDEIMAASQLLSSSGAPMNYSMSGLHQMARWDRLWSCPYCDRATSFSNVEALSYHIQTFHLTLPTLERPLLVTRPDTAPSSAGSAICIICHAQLPDMVALVAHIHAAHAEDRAAAGGKRPRLTASSGGGGESMVAPSTSPPPPPPPASTLAAPLICNTCGERFTDFEPYRVHFQQRHLEHAPPSPPPLVSPVSTRCLHCGVTFSSARQLRRHVAAELRRQTAWHFCRACSCGFSSAAGLSQHHSERHVHTVYRCALCAAVFESSAEVQTHLSTEHCQQRRVLVCGACGDSGRHFADDDEFWRHVSDTHLTLAATAAVSNDTTSASSLFCLDTRQIPPLCRTPPTTAAARHKCNICDAVLHHSSALARHKLSHCKVVRAELCAMCKQPITSLSDFKRHTALHSHSGGGGGIVAGAVFPVSCVVCQQTLAGDTELSLHAEFHLTPLDVGADAQEPSNTVAARATAATPLGPTTAGLYHNQQTVLPPGDSWRQCRRPQQPQPAAAAAAANNCSLCHTQLPSGRQLQVHLVEHSFEGCAGFSCYICAAVFTTAHALLAHMHTHGADAQPFDCAACAERFFFRAQLQHHTAHCQLATLTDAPARDGGNNADDVQCATLKKDGSEEKESDEDKASSPSVAEPLKLPSDIKPSSEAGVVEEAEPGDLNRRDSCESEASLNVTI